MALPSEFHQPSRAASLLGCTRQRVDPPFKPPTLLNGLGCWFQVSMEAHDLGGGPLDGAERRPRRMAWRVMTEKSASSGDPGALTGPLEPGRARSGRPARASPDEQRGAGQKYRRRFQRLGLFGWELSGPFPGRPPQVGVQRAEDALDSPIR